MSNTDLDKQLEVCKQQTASMKAAMDTHQKNIDAYNAEISKLGAEINSLRARGYGVQASNIRSRFTGFTTPGLSGRNTACLTGPYKEGENVFNDGGFYARQRMSWPIACGPLTNCEDRHFDQGGPWDLEVKKGCVQSLKEFNPQWDTLDIGSVAYESRKIHNLSCKGTGPTTPYCFKTQGRFDWENGEIKRRQDRISELERAKTNLKPPTINLNCSICNQVNTSACGAGADCNVQQINTCQQTMAEIEKMYNDCKAKGGRFDPNTKACVMPSPTPVPTPVPVPVPQPPIAPPAPTPMPVAQAPVPPASNNILYLSLIHI